MSNNTHHGYEGQSDPDGHNETMGVYSNDWLRQSNYISPEWNLPYPDPAVTNPEELATFPRQVKLEHHEHHHHHEHLVAKRTPARDGTTITRTDNQPDSRGFI